MRTEIDTNVISALWSREPLASKMVTALGRAASDGGLVICGPVYAELLAHPHATIPFVDDFLSRTNIRMDFPMDESVWREAARAYAGYAMRRRKSKEGTPKRLLVDFIVGAHAMLQADRLLTLDGGRYSQDFPNLRIFGDL